MFLFLVLLNAIVIGGFCSYIAGQKNRSGFNWFVLGALFSLLALFALIAVPKLDETDSLRELGSIGAEVSLNSKASNDLFQDEPDLASDKYQLYLTKKFDIQKNATLEKYVVLDKLFQTLKEALEYAHGLSQKLVESARLEKLRSAYLIMKVNEYGKAKAAGVLVGDFLVSYNGCSISMDQELTDAIAGLNAKTALLQVIRQGKLTPIEVGAGRLGIDGEITALGQVEYEIRLKSLAVS